MHTVVLVSSRRAAWQRWYADMVVVSCEPLEKAPGGPPPRLFRFAVHIRRHHSRCEVQAPFSNTISSVAVLCDRSWPSYAVDRCVTYLRERWRSWTLSGRQWW